MTPAEKALHDELANKTRVPWEKRGFEDALNDRVRVPVGASMYTTDRYVAGHRDGQHLKALREAAAQDDGFRYDQAKMFPSFGDPRRMTD